MQRGIQGLERAESAWPVEPVVAPVTSEDEERERRFHAEPICFCCESADVVEYCIKDELYYCAAHQWPQEEYR